MTSRGTGLAWLAAPVAAGTFALTTGWTLHHQPLQLQGAGTTTVSAAQQAELLSVQHSARLAARRLAHVQASVLRLEASLQRRSIRTDRLATTIRRATGSSAAVAGGPLGGSTGALPGAALPPVSVPSTTHTTTGAS